MPSSGEDIPLISGRPVGAHRNAADTAPTALRRSMSMISRVCSRLPSSQSNGNQALESVLKDLEVDEQQTTRAKLLSLAAIVFHVLGGATALYMLEGWTFVDCLYFCIVTTTTVGYGDITPSRPLSKLFVISYVIISIALISALLAYMVGVLLDQQEELLLATLFHEETVEQPTLEAGVPEMSHNSSLTERIFRYTTGLDWADYCGLAVSIFWLVVIIIVGVTVFLVAEQLSFVDALYATVISASTVGFGDFEPTYDFSKIVMTIWLLFSTIGVVRVIADFTDARVKIKQRAVSRRLLTAQMDVQSIKAMDRNKDGSVDKAEFLSELLVRTGKVERLEINAILARFEQLDKDASGGINTRDNLNEI